MAELADAPDLGSGVESMGVQVPLPAPNSTNPNLFLVGDGFGFAISIEHPNFNNQKNLARY